MGVVGLWLRMVCLPAAVCCMLPCLWRCLAGWCTWGCAVGGWWSVVAMQGRCVQQGLHVQQGLPVQQGVQWHVCLYRCDMSCRTSRCSQQQQRWQHAMQCRVPCSAPDGEGVVIALAADEGQLIHWQAQGLPACAVLLHGAGAGGRCHCDVKRMKQSQRLPGMCWCRRATSLNTCKVAVGVHASHAQRCVDMYVPVPQVYSCNQDQMGAARCTCSAVMSCCVLRHWPRDRCGAKAVMPLLGSLLRSLHHGNVASSCA